MKKIGLVLIILLLITSCSSQNNETVKSSNSENTELITSVQNNVPEEVEEVKPNYDELLGKVIILEDEKYRVIGVEGSEVKVVAFKSAGSGSFGSSSGISFGNHKGIQYAGSNGDSIMNKWYENLSDTMKVAIVPKEIKQNIFLYSSKPEGNSINLGWSASGAYDIDLNEAITIGERYVYSADLKDLIDYLGYGMTKADLDELFYAESEDKNFIWFRSALTMDNYTGVNLAIIHTNSIGLTCLSQELSSYGDYGSGTFRPCFVIDLSKIEYSLN